MNIYLLVLIPIFICILVVILVYSFKRSSSKDILEIKSLVRQIKNDYSDLIPKFTQNELALFKTTILNTIKNRRTI